MPQRPDVCSFICASIAVLTVAFAGCHEPLPSRECVQDSDCELGSPGGACFASESGRSWCVVPAPSEDCASGARWGILAGEGLAGTCYEYPPVPPMADAGPPGPPALIVPWNGRATGSVWADSPALTEKPGEPTFLWSPVIEGGHYDIEIDDSCSPDDLASCDFPSPEATHSGELPVFYPPPLPVSSVPPVGRRYYWHVRACGFLGCSPWSHVRFVDVGRQANDYNGDGYADVLVGAPSPASPAAPGPGHAYVFWGGAGASFDEHPDVVLNGAGTSGLMGVSVASAGDVNGDGFADVIVGAPDVGVSGEAYVYYGRAEGGFTSPDLVLEGPIAGERFGTSVAAAGDVNADGYADILVGAAGSSSAHVFIYLGPDHLSAERSFTFANGDWRKRPPVMASAGDMNGDGYGDVAVANQYSPSILIFGGGPGPFDQDSDAEILLGAISSVTSAGDVNGDGFPDLAVGTRDSIGAGAGAGHAFVFLGGGDSFATTPAASFTESLDGQVGGADLNGDGFSDVFAGAPYVSPVATNHPRALIYNGALGAVLDAQADATLTSLHFSDNFGAAVASPGDVNGDGYADICVGAPLDDAGGSHAGRVFIYLGNPGAILDGVPDGTLTGQSSNDQFGFAVD